MVVGALFVGEVLEAVPTAGGAVEVEAFQAVEAGVNDKAEDFSGMVIFEKNSTISSSLGNFRNPVPEECTSQPHKHGYCSLYIPICILVGF